MSYRLTASESVQTGVQRIAREQIGKALAEIDDPDLDRHDTVHQVRKRCKKIRGLVRLVRPCFEDTYQRENAHYRDAARTLSDVRDATAVLETLDALLHRFGDQVQRNALFAPIRERLETQRRRLADDEQDLDRRIEEFAARMREGRARVDGWEIDADGPDAGGFDAVTDGLQKTYRRGKNALSAARDEPTSDQLHEWRKRVKYHWYHCRLLRNVWPDLLEPRAQATHHLSDLLGDDHDLAVLRARLTADPQTYGGADDLQAFLGLLDRRRAELQSRALPLGERLFAEEPQVLAARFGTYWRAWQEEAERLPVAGAQPVPVDR